MRISSPNFTHNKSIPARFTCEGEDVSPALNWENPPHGVKSFALIMDDPDATVGTWVHWVLYNIPSSTSMLEEAMPPLEKLPNGTTQGKNSWGRHGYGGPCPPSGNHRYFFKLYALNLVPDLPNGLNKEEFLKAIEEKIISSADLVGLYQKKLNRGKG